MNKSEFISHIASKNDISKSEAEKALNFIISSITEALSQDDEINIVGFGSFKVQHRSARQGRNPKTGSVIEIPASKLPLFKAGKLLKDACNK